jgi:ABC-type Fe3+/spermidine/putrescine transport system ATPase subunit
MGVLIDIKGLHKQFGAVAAVQALDLDIREGEFFTLLGPSGCGKTTTLRLVGGLERPDRGTLTLDGRCLAAPQRGVFVNPEKRNMGMVFQSYALWPHMTVFENVAYPLKLRWVKKDIIRRKVEDALALVGLAGFGERHATALSGGQQQRVALARALVFSPRVLLLDEPLSNLDAQLRDEMRKELKALQRKLGLTVLMVTHDQVEALSMSDRVGLMNKGRLEQVDTPENVYHRPETTFVRDFLGKMFALRGTVAHIADTHVGVALKGCEGAPVAVRTNGGQAQLGRDVVIAIRPEQIAVANGLTNGGGNAVRVVVTDSQFLGDCHEYTISVGSQVHTLALQAAKKFVPGQEIFLKLADDKITLWNVG